MKTLFILLIFLLNFAFALPTDEFDSGKSFLKLSPDEKLLLYDDLKNPGLYLVNLETQSVLQIASGHGITQFASWSPDGKFVAFKMFQNDLQIPCIFDVQNNKFIILHDPVPLAGVPEVNSRGNINFTIGNQLFITDSTAKILKKINLNSYSNLTSLSADSRFLVYNDDRDRLHLIDLKEKNDVVISPLEKSCFNPRWHKQKNQLFFQTFENEIYIYDVDQVRLIKVADGIHLSWSADGKFLLFTKIEIEETSEILSSEILAYDLQSYSLIELTATVDQFEDFASLGSSGQLYFKRTNLKAQELLKQKIIEPATQQFIFNGSEERLAFPQKVNQVKIPSFNIPTVPLENQAFSYEIPYVNQYYDPPEWFYGTSACGGTSATMCIAYYGLLPKRVRNVYNPYFHTTSYGDYICGKYTYNNYTFDIWAYDPRGTKGYGAFGFIVRNGSQAWADTKGFMAEFARKHGLFSEVDWNPTRSKLMDEANAQKPFVLLNSITSAGHYMAVIGYEKKATTVIVNDPAGNKNNGGYFNYQGKGAKYDWPGYSNGHLNLNTVWCYIYFRDKCADLSPISLATSDSLILKRSFPLAFTITNLGNQESDSALAKVYLSQYAQTKPAPQEVLQTLPLQQIAAQDSINLSAEIVLNDSLVSGTYYLGLYLQPGSHRNEASFDNNVIYKRVPVIGYPNIFRPSPRNTIKENLPVIKVYFVDPSSKIDYQKTKLFVDSLDVSLQCQLNSTSIAYMPDDPLAEGLHTVQVEVTNTNDFCSKYAWQFEVDSKTSISSNPEIPENELRLLPNYPNPFNEQTIINFKLPLTTNVKLELFNIRGQLIEEILSKTLNSGSHQVQITAGDLASGIYILKLQAGEQTRLRRILLIK